MSVFGQQQPNAVERLVTPGPGDSVSSVKFSPQTGACILGVASWDGQLRIYQVSETGCNPVAITPQTSPSDPILDFCWDETGQSVFYVTASGKVLAWQPGNASTAPTPIGQHQGAAIAVRYMSSKKIVLTAGHDKYLHYWNCQQNTAISSLQLPEKAFSLDISSDNTMGIVATANRHFVVINLEKPSEVAFSFFSPLRYQTRRVAFLRNMAGVVIGSVEGRGAIRYFKEAELKHSFEFQCHRSTGAITMVNALASHPSQPIIATGGGDGVISFWAYQTKQALQSLPAQNQAIVSMDFHPTMPMLAYACSYDWSKGSNGFKPEIESFIKIRTLMDADFKPV